MIPNSRDIIRMYWHQRHDKAWRGTVRSAIEVAKGEKNGLFGKEIWAHPKVGDRS